MIYPKSFQRMSVPAMRRYIIEHNVHAALADRIIADELERRDAARPLRKKREQHIRLWNQIIDPAVSELRNVQHMLKLTLLYPTIERTVALEAYAGVLERLIGKLKLHVDKLKVSDDDIEDDLMTPSKQAIKPTKAFPNGKPNGGTHWVDYVPPDIVKDITALFDAIPRTKGVKRKHPFLTVLDKATSARRKAALIERTTKELTHIERIVAVRLADPKLKDTSVFTHQEIDAQRMQVSKMQSALHIISLLPPNAFIPPTWHGVMTARTKPGVSPLPKGQK